MLSKYSLKVYSSRMKDYSKTAAWITEPSRTLCTQSFCHLTDLVV